MSPSLALVLLLNSVATCAGNATRRPNLVLVLSDDQGWGDVSYNSNAYQSSSYGTNWTLNPPRTPNLDAMAKSEHSIVFHRFYAGSGVCSPTRAAFLTGRSPERDCIDNAEGCGTLPAWSCVEKYPLPPPAFTLAEAAKGAGYSTLHVGKWHLGDFFPKDATNPSAAQRQWPVSHPGLHGFDEFHSTEASAPSSTTNCGCKREWWESSPGCIIGGGEWQNKSYPCTNYWSPTDLNEAHRPSLRPECRASNTSQRDCVANLTTKIAGDDTAYIMDTFENFLRRKTTPGSPEGGRPFLAVLWLHTNHEPHPALPEFYGAYNDTCGDPAGDYLGTITQMDSQIGRLRRMLKEYGVSNDTLLWFTSDNGPHAADRDSCNEYNALPSTNGLRQCKGTLWEGGIRVPGVVEWPAVIRHSKTSWYPAYVSDFLPTILDILGVAHAKPGWAADGISLLPLIRQIGSSPSSTTTTQRPSDHPLVFKLGKQTALIDNNLKLLESPSVGQCDEERGSVFGQGRTLGLFRLDLDPTESVDLSKSQEYAGAFAELKAKLASFKSSVAASRTYESGCGRNDQDGNNVLEQGDDRVDL